MSTLYAKFGDVNAEFAGIPAKLASKQDKEAGKGLSTDDFVENSDHASLRARATIKSDVGLGGVQNFGIATQGEAEASTTASKKVTPFSIHKAFEKRYTYGSAEPNNADGAPEGSIYFRYGSFAWAYIKIAGVYIPANSNIKIGGEYKIGKPYIKVNGQWELAWMPVFGGQDIYETNIGGTNYIVHKFTNTGTSQLVVAESTNVDVLIVGGGGAAGLSRLASMPIQAWGGGGGGAGGWLHYTGLNVSAGTYNIVVGNGGNGSTTAGSAQAGGNSTAFGNTANGGGQGGCSGINNIQRRGKAGGCGGGTAGNASMATFRASGSQGGDGGDGHTSETWERMNGGGGGGAGGDGGDGSNTTGANGRGQGGSGITNNITGTSVEYAKGGDGAYRMTTSGGNGQHGVSAAANTGGGGHAGRFCIATSTYRGGNGGSGIVIIRYQIN